MDEVLSELLNDLEDVGSRHEELYDSECREQISGPIFEAFLANRKDYVLPDDFGLFSEGANAAVKASLAKFISKATTLSQELGLMTFHQRLSAFQNEDVRSSEGQYYDSFFGYWNPDSFDESGSSVQA